MSYVRKSNLLLVALVLQRTKTLTIVVSLSFAERYVSSAHVPEAAFRGLCFIPKWLLNLLNQIFDRKSHNWSNPCDE